VAFHKEFVDINDLAVTVVQFVGGVNKHNHRDSPLLRRSHDYLLNRAGIGVNKYSRCVT
jgi:hypothetical protein